MTAVPTQTQSSNRSTGAEPFGFAQRKLRPTPPNLLCYH